MTVTPDRVHETLRRHLLVDGFDLVLDTHASRGSWLVDARDGARHLDLFSFFASAPLGMNHPALVDDPDFVTELVEVAVNKPSNSDIYTTYLARLRRDVRARARRPRAAAPVLRRRRRARPSRTR